MITAIAIRKGKKKGEYRAYYSHKRDGWEGGGNLLDFYPVSGMLVAVSPLNQKPVFVFNDIDHARTEMEKHYGVMPIME